VKFLNPGLDFKLGPIFNSNFNFIMGELELELIQTHMAQKPMLRAEVYARALRASQNVKESGGMGRRAMRLMSGRGVGECGSGRHSYGVARSLK
jgi:hypothetical protein